MKELGYFISMIFVYFINVLFFFSGICLNSLVIFTFWRSSQLRKKSCYFMIMVLSCFDLLAALVSIPFSVLMAMLWLTGKLGVYAKWVYTYGLVANIPVAMSLKALLVMNFDRYLAISHPMFHRTSVTKSKLLILLAAVKPELILFSDASNEAYGAAAYVRWTLTNGTFAAQLIASRNRIAPVKIIDIVRLELTGPVLSKRLRTLIQKESRYTFGAVYHIVDSEIVEAVISKNSYGFSIYAANRISKIQQDIDPSEWFWTAGRLKIEDWLIRGKSPGELGQDTTWQTGRLPLAASG